MFNVTLGKCEVNGQKALLVLCRSSVTYLYFNDIVNLGFI